MGSRAKAFRRAPALTNDVLQYCMWHRPVARTLSAKSPSACGAGGGAGPEVQPVVGRLWDIRPAPLAGVDSGIRHAVGSTRLHGLTRALAHQRTTPLIPGTLRDSFVAHPPAAERQGECTAVGSCMDKLAKDS